MASFCPTCRGLMRPQKGTLQCIRCASAGRSRTVLSKGRRLHLAEGQQGLDSVRAVSSGPAPGGFDTTLRPRRSDWRPAGKGAPHPEFGLFPFDTIRDGQRRFTRDVTMAVRAGKHLVAQAPTGIGKTAASLAPAVADALASDRTVLFLTSRQSQHRIAVDTLRTIMERRGAGVRIVDLVSKRDMCLRPEADGMHPASFPDFCSSETRNKSCQFLGDVDDATLERVHDGVLHVEELMQVAKESGLCPHKVALEAAGEAHVVVADYNHLFSDIRAQSLERLGLDLHRSVVIVDEAHNLPDRIKNAHGHKITTWLLDHAEAEVRGQKDRALEADLAALRAALTRLSKEAERDGKARDEPMGDGRARIARLEIDDLHAAFEEARRTLLGTNRTLRDTVEDLDPVVKAIRKGTDAVVQCETLQKALEDWGRFRDGALRYLRWDEDGPELHVRLLDPGVVAREVFSACHASVLMSGTIVPEMVRDLLGLVPERTQMRAYPSPFPAENRVVAVAHGIHTRYRNRGDALWDRLAAQVIRLAEAAQGNIAVFCPSYQILRDVRAATNAIGTTKEDLVEDPSWGKSERDQVLDDLKGARKRGGAILWGVMGGSFAEGVDFKDGLLAAVALVGLPLAPPDLELEAATEYLERRFPGRGRLYAATYPAMNKVLQAMGRPIRGPGDKAAILLLDERFRGPPYRALLPDVLVTRDPAAPAAAFLAHHGL